LSNRCCEKQIVLNDKKKQKTKNKKQKQNKKNFTQVATCQTWTPLFGVESGVFTGKNDLIQWVRLHVQDTHSR
jgi:beta-lactamase class D